MDNGIELTVENDNFVALAESFRVFIPGKGKPSPQNGEKKPGSIPIYIRRITLDCKRSGAKFKFPLTRRKGVSQFGDSRESANKITSWTVPEFRKELARMMGDALAVSLMNVVVD